MIKTATEEQYINLRQLTQKHSFATLPYESSLSHPSLQGIKYPDYYQILRILKDN